jgi:hypothetical protein
MYGYVQSCRGWYDAGAACATEDIICWGCLLVCCGCRHSAKELAGMCNVLQLHQQGLSLRALCQHCP